MFCKIIAKTGHICCGEINEAEDLKIWLNLVITS